MAAKNESVFSNTRLLLVGLVFGVIGMIMTFVYVRMSVQSQTGGSMEVYFLVKDLAVGEKLELRHVRPVPVPGSFAEVGNKIVKIGPNGDEFSKVEGFTPFRKLEIGEPLLFNDFQTSQLTMRKIATPPNAVTRALMVDRKNNPGQLLDIGSIVTLTANYNLVVKMPPQPENLRVLEAVQVVTINGKPFPTEGDRSNVSSIGVIMGKDTARWLKKLESRIDGGYDVLVLPLDTVRSAPNAEIPATVLSYVIEKLGPLDEK